MLQKLLLVFCFGGLGSVCRYLLSLWLPSKPFSWGVLLSNALGCLVIGFIMQLVVSKQIPEATKLAIAIGFCGGFTTFSSFSADIVSLLQQQKFLIAGAYIMASLAIGLIGVFAGLYLGKQL